MSKHIPKISDAEWEVMKIIWAKPKITANEIIEELEHKQWSPKTIRTLIKRLVEKEALHYEQEGKQYTYFPLVEEEDCIRQETQSFMKRIYGGALQPMLVHFLKNEQLSKRDIEELKSILEQREE